MRRQGTDEAIRDAKQVTRLAGEGIVAPALTPGAARRRPGGACAASTGVVRGARARATPVVRVKIWTPDGRIVYSDEHR